jgi:hypothetical protein
MYLSTRFINKQDKPQTGIFNAAEFIWDDNSTSDVDERLLKDIYAWFKQNLDVPKHFHSDYRTIGWERNALSWFKDSAKEHIIKMRDLIEILERYDLIVERIATKHPGQIVYEDDYQISAIPWNPPRKK